MTISHEDPAKIAGLAEAMKKGDFCKFVIPVPQELMDTTAGSYGRDNERQALLEAQTKSNIEKYGYGNWYDFCVGRWHTKWDVDCDDSIDLDNDGKTIQASFDSAWAPPTGVYAELVEQGYTVTAYYYEPGMGFVGKWEDGRDACYEYHTATSETVRDLIGEELDDYFGISKELAQYEEED